MTASCNICGAPWHPATGHFISEKMVWCGPCTKAWVRELVGMQKRRWGGLRFYEHATVPPSASLSRYTFHVDLFEPLDGSTSRFKVLTLKAEGVTVEEAYLKIESQIPAGHRVWCWTEEK